MIMKFQTLILIFFIRVFIYITENRFLASTNAKLKLHALLVKFTLSRR